MDTGPSEMCRSRLGHGIRWIRLCCPSKTEKTIARISPKLLIQLTGLYKAAHFWNVYKFLLFNIQMDSDGVFLWVFSCFLIFGRSPWCSTSRRAHISCKVPDPKLATARDLGHDQPGGVQGEHSEPKWKKQITFSIKRSIEEPRLFSFQLCLI